MRSVESIALGGAIAGGLAAFSGVRLLIWGAPDAAHKLMQAVPVELATLNVLPLLVLIAAYALHR